jgi:hypothetical protein
MGQAINNPGESALPEGVAADKPGALEARVIRSMAITTAVAVIAGALFTPWRVATGLLLGGALSLLNHHWLRHSIAAALHVEVVGQGPQVKAAGYILRYFFVFAIVAVAYQLNLVSLPATIAGLCSFVAALFVEAFRQSYFAIIHREESN